MKNVIGLDVGGTKILAGIFTECDFKKPQKTFQITTNANEGREKVLENIITAIGKLCDKNTQSIGIAWAGFVDAKKGLIKKSPNLPGFENFPIAEFLTKETSLPVFIENDARLFALAERQIFDPKTSSFLGITLGTGVGAGLILDGNIISGCQGFAGEIGHQNFYSENISAEKLFAGPGLEKLLGNNFKNINNANIDKKTREKMIPRVDQFSNWIYNLVLTLNPEKIVLGGSVGIYFWSIFFKEISKKVNEMIKDKNLPIKFEIEKSRLKNAGLVGAAIWADRKYL